MSYTRAQTERSKARRASPPIPSRAANAYGKPCPYCANAMRGRSPHRGDLPTREHVNPRALGGGPTIMVCRKCNGDKASLTLREWSAVLLIRNDYRAKTVGALLAEIDAGRIKFANTDTGLAVGVFA